MIGFHCSHEQHSPSSLLEYAIKATRAGFKHTMCSDHLAPWSVRQGHSGYTWSWLGSALQATPTTWGTVCAPGQRYHPVIIAQAAATLAEMFPDRFWVALGSGEAVNETVTGQGWPPKPDRNQRLRESAEIMRALWAGETVNLRSHVTAKDARIWVRPSRPPMIVGAALSADTARFVGEWADALITVAGPRDAMREVITAFRETGGNKPMFLQVTLSFAPTDEESQAIALDQWVQAMVGPEKLADLDSPEAFDREAAGATVDDIADKVRMSADVEQHLDWLRQDLDMGFERIYVHNVARQHLDRFIDIWAERVLPTLT